MAEFTNEQLAKLATIHTEDILQDLFFSHPEWNTEQATKVALGTAIGLVVSSLTLVAQPGKEHLMVKSGLDFFIDSLAATFRKNGYDVDMFALVKDEEGPQGA